MNHENRNLETTRIYTRLAAVDLKKTPKKAPSKGIAEKILEKG